MVKTYKKFLGLYAISIIVVSLPLLCNYITVYNAYEVMPYENLVNNTHYVILTIIANSLLKAKIFFMKIFVFIFWPIGILFFIDCG